MSIYGKLDADAFANTIAVTNGDATVTKNAADTVEVGDVLGHSWRCIHRKASNKHHFY